jgi:hypothetical protein
VAPPERYRIVWPSRIVVALLTTAVNWIGASRPSGFDPTEMRGASFIAISSLRTSSCL